mgnify:CR=1 FL=1
MKFLHYILLVLAGISFFTKDAHTQVNSPISLFQNGEFYAFGKTPQQILNFYGHDELRSDYSDSGDKTLEHISNGGLIIFYFDDDNRCNRIKAGELDVPYVNQLMHYCKNSLNFEYSGDNIWFRKKTNELFRMDRAEGAPVVIIGYIDREGLREIGREHLLD